LTSVADPIPDPIPDPRTATKRRGKNLLNFFVATNIIKLKIIFLNRLRKKFEPVHKGLCVWDPVSEIRKKSTPDLGSGG
jgi:hypothetical protein